MPNPDDVFVYTRRTGESARAFEAYQTYRDLGAARSLAGVGQKLHKSVTILGRWSSRWGWVERAAAYDADLAAKEKAAKDYALEAESKKWAERQIAAREMYWQRAELLDRKAELIMQFPLQEVERKTQVSEDGKTIVNLTVIKPVHATPRDAAIISKVAFEIRESSLHEEGERATGQGTGGGGSMLPENIEEIRRKRWIDAAPALLALMEAKQAEREGGQDGNGAEVNTG